MNQGRGTYLRLLHFSLQGCDNSPQDRETWISKDGIIWNWVKYPFLKWARPSFWWIIPSLLCQYEASTSLAWTSEWLCSAANKCQAKSNPCIVRCWHLFVERRSDSEIKIMGTETHGWIFSLVCLFVCQPPSSKCYIWGLPQLSYCPATPEEPCDWASLLLGTMGLNGANCLSFTTTWRIWDHLREIN